MLTIAGSDSGGGAGIQADMRTIALLGLHACVAVTAVTVQNTLGVKGFHEVPDDVVAGQIEAVVTDIGIQAAKTGMLASSAIIGTVAATWRRLELTVPLVVDPVCASMHGDALLAPEALDSLRAQLFPLATLVTPNLDEVRLLVDIDVVDSTIAARRGEGAARAGPALGAGQRRAPTVLDTQLRPALRRRRLLRVRRAARDTGNDHGGGDTLAAAIACGLAHGFSVPDAVAFGKRWVTECLRAAYPLGRGHGPVSPLFRLS